MLIFLILASAAKSFKKDKNFKVWVAKGKKPKERRGGGASAWHLRVKVKVCQFLFKS